MPNTFTKDPDAVLDYTVDWSAWLTTGDTITASSWTVEAGLTKDTDANTDSAATVWLSGGTAGSDYQCTNEIETADGRTDDRTITILVRER